MKADKILKRLINKQRHLTVPGSNDHLITTVKRRLIGMTCAVCGKEFQAVQIGKRMPSTRCSEACRREGRRRYSNAYNASAKTELAELRARAASGEFERIGIGRDGQPLTASSSDFRDPRKDR